MSTFLQPLDDALGTRSKVRILRVLLRREDELSGREVARQSGVSSHTAYRALEELADLGIVHRETSPAEHQFSINRRHILVKNGLEGLFSAERRAVDQAFDTLQTTCSRLSRETKADIRAAWLFGSAMRGEDRPSSDLDLLIVTDGSEGTNELREELVEIGDDFRNDFGLQLSPVVLTVERLREMDADEAPLTRSVRSDARRVFGSRVREVLDGEA